VKIIPVLLILCYNGSLVTRTVVSLTTKFNSLILVFSVSGFALSFGVKILNLMVLYDVSLPAQLRCIIVFIRKEEIHVQIADRCAPSKISNGAENSVL
jgi:dUTPase